MENVPFMPRFLNEMVEFVGYTIGLIIGETSYRYVCNVTQKEIWKFI